VLTGEEILATTALTALLALVLVVGLRDDACSIAWQHAFRGCAIAIAVFALCAALPVAVQFAGPQHVRGLLQRSSEFVTESLNVVVPTRLQLLAPGVALEMSTHFSGWKEEQNAYLGVPLLALLMYVVLRWWGTCLVRWAGTVALVMAILSMGPRVAVAGRVTPIPLPWDLVARLPMVGHILPSRLMLYVYLMAALLLAVFLDRQRRLSRRRRLVGYAAAALALIPLIPQPNVPVTANPVPPFFAGGMVTCIPARSVALVAPFARHQWWYGDGSWSRAMLWQASARMRFRMPEGYAFVPGPRGNSSLDPPPSAMQRVMFDVQQGERTPAMSGRLQRQLAHDLRRWQVRTVLVGPMRYRREMRHLVAQVLGRGPQQSGGMDVWWNVGQSSGQPVRQPCAL
jgi:hypothetical protein